MLGKSILSDSRSDRISQEVSPGTFWRYINMVGRDRPVDSALVDRIKINCTVNGHCRPLAERWHTDRHQDMGATRVGQLPVKVMVVSRISVATCRKPIPPVHGSRST